MAKKDVIRESCEEVLLEICEEYSALISCGCISYKKWSRWIHYLESQLLTLEQDIYNYPDLHAIFKKLVSEIQDYFRNFRWKESYGQTYTVDHLPWQVARFEEHLFHNAWAYWFPGNCKNIGYFVDIWNHFQNSYAIRREVGKLTGDVSETEEREQIKLLAEISTELTIYQELQDSNMSRLKYGVLWSDGAKLLSMARADSKNKENQKRFNAFIREKEADPHYKDHWGFLIRALLDLVKTHPYYPNINGILTTFQLINRVGKLREEDASYTEHVAQIYKSHIEKLENK